MLKNDAAKARFNDELHELMNGEEEHHKELRRLFLEGYILFDVEETGEFSVILCREGK